MLSRKYHNTLYISGIIFIAFSVWSAIRDIAFMFLSSNGLAYFVAIEEKTMMGITGVLSLVMVAAGFLLRIYVGRCAMIEGRGGRKNGIYIVLAILMAIMALFGIAFCCFVYSSIYSKGTIIISIVVEITSLINMIELISSSLRVRKIRREAD